MNHPAGPTKARAPEYRQAGAKINKPQSKAEKRQKPASQLQGSPNPGEVAREGREWRKGSAIAGLLTAVPNGNKRKNKDGGGKERVGRRRRGDGTGRGV